MLPPNISIPRGEKTKFGGVSACMIYFILLLFSSCVKEGQEFRMKTLQYFFNIMKDLI